MQSTLRKFAGSGHTKTIIADNTFTSEIMEKALEFMYLGQVDLKKDEIPEFMRFTIEYKLKIRMEENSNDVETPLILDQGLAVRHQNMIAVNRESVEHSGLPLDRPTIPYLITVPPQAHVNNNIIQPGMGLENSFLTFAMKQSLLAIANGFPRSLSLGTHNGNSSSHRVLDTPARRISAPLLNTGINRRTSTSPIDLIDKNGTLDLSKVSSSSSPFDRIPLHPFVSAASVVHQFQQQQHYEQLDRSAKLNRTPTPEFRNCKRGRESDDLQTLNVNYTAQDSPGSEQIVEDSSPSTPDHNHYDAESSDSKIDVGGDLTDERTNIPTSIAYGLSPAETVNPNTNGNYGNLLNTEAYI